MRRAQARANARPGRTLRPSVRIGLMINAAMLAPGGALLCWVAAMAYAAGPSAAWSPTAFGVAVVALFGMGEACVILAGLSLWNARP